MHLTIFLQRGQNAFITEAAPGEVRPLIHPSPGSAGSGSLEEGTATDPSGTKRNASSSAPRGTHPTEPGSRQLIEQLQQDRLWLLRQLDAGRWPQWRYDLAALERELGQLLDHAGERWPEG